MTKMEVPLELDVQGAALTSPVLAMIPPLLEKLENRFGRITKCRLAIRAPGYHHNAGEPFAVSMHLTLPQGREVNIGRISNGADPRQADLVFAIHDTFRKAVRQLQRQAQKSRDVRKGRDA